jgi:hypothetical protein
VARAAWYGVSGVPTVRLDGSRVSIGGDGGCSVCYDNYLNLYNQRLSETSGTSPVEITGSFAAFGNSGSVQATFRLLDPVILGPVRATLLVYEDDITWCCGYGDEDHWDDIVRTIKDDSLYLSHPGDERTVVKEITIPAGWNLANLHAVAVLQQMTGDKQVIQSVRLTDAVDFTLLVPRRIGSVPSGNGQGIFPATVHNVSATDDVLTLFVDQAMGWPTDFQIEGDPTWYTSRPVTLEAGASKAISIRVRTDGVRRVGTGSFSVTSGNSGRTQPAAMRLFNRSHSILLVDNDDGMTWGSGGPPCEAPFTNALDDLNCLYDYWDPLNAPLGATPTALQMHGFDVVIWQSGIYYAHPVTADDCANLAQYLDSGGSLFMSSMDLLSVQTVPSSFIHDYLGLASFTNNTMCHTASGLTHDPITDGMVLPLTWWTGDQPNRVDTTIPGPNARAILVSETDHPNAVRFQGANFRVVFSTILQNTISEIAPAPNNSEALIQRTLAWLTESGVSATPYPDAGGAAAIVSAQPNPFSPRTGVTFRVLSTGGDIRLTLVDASGRLVRTLLDGKPRLGMHEIRWDGRDESGRPSASGVYFARLRGREGETTQKLVLAR